MSRVEQQQWLKRERNGEAPPYAPELVRRYPTLFLKFYTEAFGDGLHGNPPRSFFPLYRLWYREGLELRQLIGSLESRPR